MIQREPKEKVAAPVAAAPTPPEMLEEVEVRDVDIHTLVGAAPFVLFPEDVYTDTPKEIKVSLARNGEVVTFQKENVAYISIRKRPMMRAKATYKPKTN